MGPATANIYESVMATLEPSFIFQMDRNSIELSGNAICLGKDIPLCSAFVAASCRKAFSSWKQAEGEASGRIWFEIRKWSELHTEENGHMRDIGKVFSILALRKKIFAFIFVLPSIKKDEERGKVSAKKIWRTGVFLLTKKVESLQSKICTVWWIFWWLKSIVENQEK